MVERGTVISVDSNKNTATVQFNRKSACDKCGMCLMSKDNMKVELTLNNTVNASAEDVVDVMLGDNYVLTSAIIVYMIPVALIAISLFVTRNMHELYQALSVGLSLLLGIVIAVIIDRKIKNHKGYSPEIINIIEKSKEEMEDGK